MKLIGVGKAYGRRVVIGNLNLTVSPGDYVEVTGPSGSGKTTVLRLLHGQLRPSAGEVWVGARALHHWWRPDLDRVRRDVAFIFQEQRLLGRLTAFENVVLGLMVNDPYVPRSALNRRALAALEALGVAHRKDAYPRQLSAGERQRVAVARALAKRPKVILADEPYTSIDRDNARAVARMLEEAAAQGTAVVVATHRPSGRATRVVQLPQASVAEATRQPAPAAGVRAARLGWQLLAGVGSATDVPAVDVAVNGHATNGHATNGHSTNGHTTNGHAVKAMAVAVAPGNGHVSNGGASARDGVRRHISRRAERRAHELPPWRRLAALVSNSFALVVLGGLRSWRRDVRFTAPALQTMSLLLVLCGLLAMVAISLGQAVAHAEAQASVVRIYLDPSAGAAQVDHLRVRLLADPRVASVREVSSAEALAEARSKPGLGSLAGLTETNPFPASLDVTVKLVTEVAAVSRLAVGDPAVDPQFPTSYDPDVYNRLSKLAIAVGVVGGALVLLFAFIAYAVSANSMRAIATSRKEEVMTLRLLGARPWMLRDPFVIEGLMTGALAGALAGAIVAVVWIATLRFAGATYVDLLPGVGLTAAREVVAGVIAAGMLLGVLTALLSFRQAGA